MFSIAGPIGGTSIEGEAKVRSTTAKSFPYLASSELLPLRVKIAPVREVPDISRFHLLSPYHPMVGNCAEGELCCTS